MCGSDMQCTKVDGQASGGVCTPAGSAFDAGACQASKGVTLVDDTLYCETCNALTTAATQLLSQTSQYTSETSPAPGPTLG